MKVDWVNDWPVFNEGRNITLLTRGRDSQVEQTKPGDVPLDWQADLKRSDLELEWYQKSKSYPTLSICLKRAVRIDTYSPCRYAPEAVILAH